MDTLADIILILSVIGLIVGLIKPGIFHKFTNGSRPKKKIGLIFGLGIIVGLILLAAFAPATPTKTVSDKTNSTKSAVTSKPSTPVTSTDTNQPTTQPATKPALRQDLAFQGDPTYCDGTYRANDNGTTTWTLDIKQTGEIITHLSDNSGHIYRHDVQITEAPNYYAYTAPVNINDVSEINGLLYVGGTSHPCNIEPQQ